MAPKFTRIILILKANKRIEYNLLCLAQSSYDHSTSVTFYFCYSQCGCNLQTNAAYIGKTDIFITVISGLIQLIKLIRLVANWNVWQIC